MPAPDPPTQKYNPSLTTTLQTKQRLPLRPLRQSVRPAQRHNRHLRQCARPARHRQHLRVLFQHDDEHQRQRTETGSHGEPRQQSGRVQIGGDYCCDGRGALVDFELVLVNTNGEMARRDMENVYILVDYHRRGVRRHMCKWDWS